MGKNKKWNQNTTVVEQLNPETGEKEVIATKKTWSSSFKKDKFYMTFIEFVSPWYELKSDTAKSLLAKMCELAEYNTGMVKLTTAVRQEICKSLSISPNTLTNNLSLLKSKNLIKGDKGDFIINAQIFWKGDAESREKLLNTPAFRVIFELDAKEEGTEITEPDFPTKSE